MLLTDGGKCSGSKGPKAQSPQTTAQYIHRKGGIKCASCSRWRGDRQVDSKKKQVSVDASGQPRGADTKSQAARAGTLSAYL